MIPHSFLNEGMFFRPTKPATWLLAAQQLFILFTLFAFFFSSSISALFSAVILCRCNGRQGMLARVLIVAQEPACDRGSCRKPNHRASTQFPRRSIPMQPAGSDGFLERKGSSHNAHKNATRSYL